MESFSSIPLIASEELTVDYSSQMLPFMLPAMATDQIEKFQ